MQRGTQRHKANWRNPRNPVREKCLPKPSPVPGQPQPHGPRDTHHYEAVWAGLQITFCTEKSHCLGTWDTLWDTEEEFWGIVQDLLWNLWWFKIDRQLNTSISLSHSLSSTDQEEKIWWKESSWFAKERSLTNYQSCHCENRLSVREINIIHCLLID